MRLHFVPVVALFATALAQDLSPGAGWREPSTSRSTSERVTIAQNAINAMVKQLDSSTAQFNGIGYWQAANVYSAMAIQDELTHSATNKAVVVNNLKLAFQKWKNFDQYGYNDDAMWWATAAYYAYRAYADTSLLNMAIAVWNNVTPFVVTQAQASAGKTPVKTSPLTATCDGATMAGGVFWRSTKDNTSINSITTGLYITLSAYLAEMTKDSKYTNAAILSANWMKAHNINSKNIVLDSESGSDCTRSPSNYIFTYNSGKLIEGLAILASVTGDNQWNQLMLNVLSAAVKNTAWQGANGIITEGASTSADNDGVGFKAIFIRGLLQTFRKTTNTSAKTLIRAYTDVQVFSRHLVCSSSLSTFSWQYNALLDLASNGSSYSASWTGPAPSAFTAWGQLAALDVLTAAVGVN